MQMQIVDVRVICEAGQGELIAKQMIEGIDITASVFQHNSHIKDADKALRKEIIKNTDRETLDRLVYVYNNTIYELIEVDVDVEHECFGYDVYEDDQADPINLGSVVYFNTKSPTYRQFKNWMSKWETTT